MPEEAKLLLLLFTDGINIHHIIKSALTELDLTWQRSSAYLQKIARSIRKGNSDSQYSVTHPTNSLDANGLAPIEERIVYCRTIARRAIGDRLVHTNE